MSFSINLISDIPTRVLKECLLKKKKADFNLFGF
jgi:hypothetical protein